MKNWNPGFVQYVQQYLKVSIFATNISEICIQIWVLNVHSVIKPLARKPTSKLTFHKFMREPLHIYALYVKSHFIHKVPKYTMKKGVAGKNLSNVVNVTKCYLQKWHCKCTEKLFIKSDSVEVYYSEKWSDLHRSSFLGWLLLEQNKSYMILFRKISTILDQVKLNPALELIHNHPSKQTKERWSGGQPAFLIMSLCLLWTFCHPMSLSIFKVYSIWLLIGGSGIIFWPHFYVYE